MGVSITSSSSQASTSLVVAFYLHGSLKCGMIADIQILTLPIATPMAQKRCFDVSFKLKAIECACRSLGLPYGRTN